MINEPRSPNVFDAVHITTAKHSSPQSQDCSYSTFYFNKRLESITQFLDFLECNPDNHAELTELQLRWERSFFKNELKAALFLNYTLIKLYCQTTDELKQVKSDIQNRTEKKKLTQQFENKLEWNLQTTQHSQEHHSNGSTALKKKTIRQAFEAEKKILQVKHQRQFDELKKTLAHKQETIRAKQEEIQYIRSEILSISEKNFLLLNDNREAEESIRKLELENKQLRSKIEQLQLCERNDKDQIRLNQLNCSPINHSIDTFGLEDAEISFNHEFLNDNMQNKLLRKQIEDIKFELDEMKEQNSRLLANNNNQNDQHMMVMQESCRLFLVELEKQYLEVKNELKLCVLQIDKYKNSIHEIQEKLSNNQTKTIEKYQSSEKKKQETKKLKQLCPNCLILAKDYQEMKLEKHQIQTKYQTLREKFDKTLNLELIQRQQWDLFLKDLKSSPTQ